MSHSVKPLPVEDLEHVLQHTRGLWSEACGTSFFITGGTGFFGMWLLETFAHVNDALGLGMQASVLTRNPEAFAVKAPHLALRRDLHFVRGDVRDFEFPAGEFTHVIHAGTTSSAPVEPLEMFDTVVQGTRRVLDFAASHGTRKLLFTSSGAVYGPLPRDLMHVPESFGAAPDIMEPSSAYGEGKRAAELLCVMMARKHGFEAKIARCFAFVGPHLPLDAHFAIGNFIRDALAGGPIQTSGDGTPFRSYLYAADLAVWLWTILFKAPTCRAFNVGSETELSISEIAHTVASQFEPLQPVQLGRSPVPHKAAERYVPSTHRAQHELGLHAAIPLVKAVQRTIAWSSQNSSVN